MHTADSSASGQCSSSSLCNNGPGVTTIISFPPIPPGKEFVIFFHTVDLCVSGEDAVSFQRHNKMLVAEF